MVHSSTKKLTPVSKTNPCIHCGKTDWCYLIENLSVCKRNFPPASGWEVTGKADQEGTPYYAPIQPKKAHRPKQTRTFEYPTRDGCKLVKVVRIDNGTGEKRIWQEQWNGSEWVMGTKGISRDSIPIYRYAEVRQAIASGQRIFIVEGETCADALWELGLAATTNIGGSGKWRESDTSDLQGAKVIICPDRDKKGIEHAQNVSRYFPNAQWLYAYPDSPIWDHLPDGSGLDVVDWINDYKLSADQILKSVEAKQRPFGKGFGSDSVGNGRNSGGDSRENNKDNGGYESSFYPSLIDQVKQLLNQSLCGVEYNAALTELSLQTGVSLQELRKLAYELQEDLNTKEDGRKELSEQLDALLKAESRDIDLAKILPPIYANPILKLANSLSLRPETYLTALLVVTSTLHKSGTRLVLHKAWDFDVFPNLYGCIVAEPSQKKSPIIKSIVTGPLGTLYKQVKEEYDLKLQEWQKEKRRYDQMGEAERKTEFPDSEPQKPTTWRRYWTNNATIEGIQEQISQFPENGILYSADELAAILLAANQYKGGKGNDEKIILEFYDGNPNVVLRASGKSREFPAGVNFGLFGSIQPDVLKNFIGDCSDGSGQWARLAFVHQPLVASVMPEDDEGGFDLSELLAGLYRSMEALPARTYRLSKEAHKYFAKVYSKLEVQRVTDPHPGVRAALGKVAGRIGKIAINLHCIDAIAQGITPSEEVPLLTVERAVELARFYVGQIRYLYANFDNTELAPQLLKVLSLAKRRNDWVKVGDIQRSITGKHRPNAETVRHWFNELSALGHGEVRQVTRSLEFRVVDAQIDENRRKIDDSSIRENLAKQGFQINVDKIDESGGSSKPITVTPASIPSQPGAVDTDTKESSILSTNAQIHCTESVLTIDDLSILVSTVSIVSTQQGDESISTSKIDENRQPELGMSAINSEGIAPPIAPLPPAYKPGDWVKFTWDKVGQLVRWEAANGWWKIDVGGSSGTAYPHQIVSLLEEATSPFK